MPLKVCANLSFMYQETSSLLERYSLAKRSGFTAVECAFPYDFSVSEVQDAKEKNNLEQVLINVYPGNFAAGELGFAAIPGKEAEFGKSLELAVIYAKALKCSVIHIMAGVVPSPTDANDKTYVANLSQAAKILQKEQMIGVIEPINSVSVPNYYLNSFEKAVSVLKEVNSPNLKLQLDIFHLQFISGNLTNNIKRYLPYTGHVQIAQVPHRHEPDVQGEIDYNYVFTLLKELQYSGWIGLEYKPAGDTKDGLKWMKML